MICGSSGSGKSTSLRNLNPDTTAIVNIERKQLPFRGYSKFKYHKFVQTASDVVTEMFNFSIKPDVEVIALESFTSYAESVIKQVRTSATGDGFKTWDNHNKLIRDFMDNNKSIKGKFVVFLAIDELLQEGSGDGVTNKSVRRCWVKGKELEGKIEKEFVICFWTLVEKELAGTMKYQFLTNTDGVCAAKTPMNMFSQLKIDNDLNAAIQVIKKYYE